MTPAVFRSFADRFHKYRWYFLAISLLSFGAIAVVIALTPKTPQPATWLVGFSFGVLVPIGLVAWGLLCACIWFHSIKGKFETNSGLWGRFPTVLQAAIKWYAAIFLTIWFFVALIIWPAQSLRLFL